MSGLKLNRDDFPGYSDEDIIGHYNTFTSFDIDSTGFISPENLLTVLTTMEVKDASPDMVKHIIEEVAILTGHVRRVAPNRARIVPPAACVATAQKSLPLDAAGQ
jgi:hypothetical protein